MATLPVDVNFINAPRDFDDSMLVYALSRKQLKVAGPADKIDMLSTLPIGNIDLSTFTLNKSYELPIDLPADIYLLDNISTITVSFDCSNLGTKTMNLPNTCGHAQMLHLSARDAGGVQGFFKCLRLSGRERQTDVANQNHLLCYPFTLVAFNAALQHIAAQCKDLAVGGHIHLSADGGDRAADERDPLRPQGRYGD